MDSEHLPSFSLDGRIALVTGANRGIGRGVVDALAAAGATVAVMARDRADAEEVAVEVTGQGGEATGHELTWRTSVRSGRRSTKWLRSTGGSTCWAPTPGSAPTIRRST